MVRIVHRLHAGYREHCLIHSSLIPMYKQLGYTPEAVQPSSWAEAIRSGACHCELCFSSAPEAAPSALAASAWPYHTTCLISAHGLYIEAPPADEEWLCPSCNALPFDALRESCREQA